MQLENVRSVFVALLFLLISTSCMACSTWRDRIYDEYEFRKGSGFIPNELKIEKAGESDEFNFELNSYWAPSPDNSGSGTTTSFFKGKAQIKGCTGFYQFKDELGNVCALIFSFQKAKNILVTSFGICNQGYNAYPDGLYQAK